MKNGDIVEMLTASDSAPSRDWIKAGLHFTGLCKSQALFLNRPILKSENAEKGRDMERELLVTCQRFLDQGKYDRLDAAPQFSNG